MTGGVRGGSATTAGATGAGSSNAMTGPGFVDGGDEVSAKIVGVGRVGAGVSWMLLVAGCGSCG
ncbi:hypothetical protein [Brevundimonas goettingensis]|uniref:Uncharacterized protein n=1 Tax=Brevundimonas goettingensis TaxID=2774190 RepID=A0A975C2V0_9CAUL|nr:hypothetical protein IFJ75_03825 [Brevundimonas goettingensis]